MKSTVSVLSQRVVAKFGKESERTFLDSYFFVRFLCPALALPQNLIDSEIADSMKKLCLLMSKMLQAAANRQTFESENMKFANEDVEKGFEKIDLILVEFGFFPRDWCEEREEERRVYVETTKAEIKKIKARGATTNSKNPFAALKKTESKCQVESVVTPLRFDKLHLNPIRYFNHLFATRATEMKRAVLSSRDQDPALSLEILNSFGAWLRSKKRESQKKKSRFFISSLFFFLILISQSFLFTNNNSHQRWPSAVDPF